MSDNHIDTHEVNQKANLLSLVSNLKKVAATGGGEWAGPCPMCGGVDRFRVEPYHKPEPRWLCRTCTPGRWNDAISLGRLLWPGENFRSICERLAGGTLPTATHKHAEPEPTPAAAPPDQEWQGQALALVERCEAALWQPVGERARAYLNGRGLNDATIKHFRLGFHQEPRGIVIPCFSNRALWYVKFRRPVGEPKYILHKGSKPAAIYNGDTLLKGDAALFVEGEFDTMLLWQEAGDLLNVATLGSATNTPDLATWGRYFLGLKTTLILPDNDQAGDKGAATVARFSKNPALVGLPDGSKDATDFYTAGGDLRAWATAVLDWHK